MNAAEIQQVNIPDSMRETDGYTRRPYSFYKLNVGARKIRRSEIILLSVIYSFTRKKREGMATCNLNYRDIQSRYDLSPATIYRATKALINAELIEREKTACARSAFSLGENTVVSDKESFILSDDFLSKITVKVKGLEKPQKLSRTAIDILGLIRTHTLNKKGKGYFSGSRRSIGKILNAGKSTVSEALDFLLNAKLISQKRGINGHLKSEFKSNESILRKYQKQAKKLERSSSTARRTPAEPSTSSDLRADRDRFYAALQDKERARLKPLEAKLAADARYVTLTKERKQLEIAQAKEEAKLELSGNASSEVLAQMKKKKKSLDVQIQRRLKANGISSEDLAPLYSCSKCHDTGFDVKTKRACDCWTPPRRRSV